MPGASDLHKKIKKTGEGSALGRNLLIEIGLEELPPKSLQILLDAFIAGFAEAFKKQGIDYEKIQGYVSPRRLALIVHNITTASQGPRIKRGPALEASFNADGKPSAALLGFAKSCNVSFESLIEHKTDKGSWMVFEEAGSAVNLEDLIPVILADTINKLPLPKRMRWNVLSESFVRPVHWIVALLNDKVLPINLFDIAADCLSYGHRFLSPTPLVISSPLEYEKILFEKGKVIADFTMRRQTILKGMEAVVEREGATINLEDYALIDEITGLVEWPVILVGEFEKQFLQLPREVLVSTLKLHQKCFPLQNAEGKLINKFIIVSNIESLNPEKVIQGNQSVVHARLSDAAFYYEQDRKKTLEDRIFALSTVVFQHDLGSLQDKTHRIVNLGEFLAEKLQHKKEAVKRAAMLSKTDLLTQMVGEFPELQGTIGKYYAIEEKETREVAEAIEQHYCPRFSEDNLPESRTAIIVSLADRLDTIVGLFALGKEPTGDKDPFALRRLAFGIVRILIEKELLLNLKEIIAFTVHNYGDLLSTAAIKKKGAILEKAVLDFCFERMPAWYQDQHIAPQVFEAVRTRQFEVPLDFHHRVLAVSEFMTLPEAESLAQANKRVSNILSKNEVPAGQNVDQKLLQEAPEKILAEKLAQKERDIEPKIKAGDYTAALKILSELKNPIDQFFDKVMVMVEDSKLRVNRMILLNRLRNLFLEIADISLL